MDFSYLNQSINQKFIIGTNFHHIYLLNFTDFKLLILKDHEIMGYSYHLGIK